MMELPGSLNVPLYQAPQLIIERQPKKRGYRFRYKSEGETHGGIPGEADPHSGSKKFYPTVKILGYNGPAKIVVTLVTSNKPYHLHAHSMIVNREPMKGYCIFEMNGSSNTLELKNIAIQHAVKERLMDTLMDRILQNRFISQFGWNSALKPGDQSVLDVDYYTHILEDRDEQNTFMDRTTAKAIAGAELKELQKSARHLSKTMAMNSCRLCFQAFLQDLNGKYTQVLDSVVSEEIIDGKTKEGATLKIVRLSAVACSVSGGDEVWLLADKLNADDVEVRFFKLDSNGQLEWEGFGEFAKSDVFKQAVLIFRTPKYKDQTIVQPVKVSLQLRRKKDRTCTSEPSTFTIKPKRYDKYCLGDKRKKDIPKQFLEGAFPKKSAVDLFSINFGQVASSIGPSQNLTQNSLNQSQNILQQSLNQNSNLAQSTLNQSQNIAAPNLHQSQNGMNLPQAFMMGNQATSNQSTGSPVPQVLSINLPSTLQSSQLQNQPNLGSLENLNLTDSFLNQLLSSDIKVEPITDRSNCDSDNLQNNVAGVSAQPSVNAYLQNFTNNLPQREFNGQAPSFWDQPGSFDVTKMEE